MFVKMYCSKSFHKNPMYRIVYLSVTFFYKNFKYYGIHKMSFLDRIEANYVYIYKKNSLAK